MKVKVYMSWYLKFQYSPWQWCWEHLVLFLTLLQSVILGLKVGVT